MALGTPTRELVTIQLHIIARSLTVADFLPAALIDPTLIFSLIKRHMLLSSFWPTSSMTVRHAIR